MDGEEAEEKSVRTFDEEQILDLLKRTQELEKQKSSLWYITYSNGNCFTGSGTYLWRFGYKGLFCRTFGGIISC